MITLAILLATMGCAPGYESVPVRGDWQCMKCCVGDLNGDGRYDYVVVHPRVSIWEWKPSQGTYKVDAYLADGTFLWRYDMGWAIEQGVIYAPLLVYDLDGDGKAEVVVKAGPPDPRDADGKVTSGAEWLVVLNGMSGQEIARSPWISRDGLDYNNYSRNKLTVAYLNGETPSVVVVRGTYIKIKAAAYQLQGKRIVRQWEWQSSGDYDFQGGHRVLAADLDRDGRDEIVYGSAALDDDGTGLWSANLHHVNPQYIARLDGKRLAVVLGRERPADGDGVSVLDARTGETIWTVGQPTHLVGGVGMVADLIADSNGLEVYAKDVGEGGKWWLFDWQGKIIGEPELDTGFLTVLWDGDEQHEILRGGAIWDYHTDWETGNKVGYYQGEVVAIADMVGDWREEFATTLPGELRLYSTSIPTRVQRDGLMASRKYRCDVSTQGNGVALFSPVADQ